MAVFPIDKLRGATPHTARLALEAAGIHSIPVTWKEDNPKDLPNNWKKPCLNYITDEEGESVHPVSQWLDGKNSNYPAVGLLDHLVIDLDKGVSASTGRALRSIDAIKAIGTTIDYGTPLIARSQNGEVQLIYEKALTFPASTVRVGGQNFDLFSGHLSRFLAFYPTPGCDLLDFYEDPEAALKDWLGADVPRCLNNAVMRVKMKMPPEPGRIPPSLAARLQAMLKVKHNEERQKKAERKNELDVVAFNALISDIINTGALTKYLEGGDSDYEQWHGLERNMAGCHVNDGIPEDVCVDALVRLARSIDNYDTDKQEESVRSRWPEKVKKVSSEDGIEKLRTIIKADDDSSWPERFEAFMKEVAILETAEGHRFYVPRTNQVVLLKGMINKPEAIALAGSRPWGGLEAQASVERQESQLKKAIKYSVGRTCVKAKTLPISDGDFPVADPPLYVRGGVRWFHRRLSEANGGIYPIRLNDPLSQPLVKAVFAAIENAANGDPVVAADLAKHMAWCVRWPGVESSILVSVVGRGGVCKTLLIKSIFQRLFGEFFLAFDPDNTDERFLTDIFEASVILLDDIEKMAPKQMAKIKRATGGGLGSSEQKGIDRTKDYFCGKFFATSNDNKVVSHMLETRRNQPVYPQQPLDEKHREVLWRTLKIPVDKATGKPQETPDENFAWCKEQVGNLYYVMLYGMWPSFAPQDAPINAASAYADRMSRLNTAATRAVSDWLRDEMPKLKRHNDSKKHDPNEHGHLMWWPDGALSEADSLIGSTAKVSLTDLFLRFDNARNAQNRPFNEFKGSMVVSDAVELRTALQTIFGDKFGWDADKKLKDACKLVLYGERQKIDGKAISTCSVNVNGVLEVLDGNLMAQQLLVQNHEVGKLADEVSAMLEKAENAGPLLCVVNGGKA